MSGRRSATCPSRIGIIGCGRQARLRHLPQYLRIPEARLVGFHDGNRERAEQLSMVYQKLLREETEKNREHGTVKNLEENIAQIRVYEDPASLIEDVDIVDVCTPPKSHVDLATEVLSRDKSVMVEKPAARTWIEAIKLKELARVSKGFYQYNENFVFDPFYMAVGRVIESGVIGDLERIHYDLGHGGPDINASLWFSDATIQGGGVLIDLGTHAFTTAWYLAGFDKVPTRVRSNAIKVSHRRRLIAGSFRNISVEDEGRLEVMLEDPKTKAWITLFLRGTWSWPEGNPSRVEGIFRIQGTKGEISRLIEPDGTVSIKIDSYGFGSKYQKTGDLFNPLTESPYSPPTSFLYEIRNFVNCVRNKTPSFVNEDIGIETLAVLGAGYLSEKLGRKTVALDQFKKFCLDLQSKYQEQASDELINNLMEPYRS